jgi:hypothetical protein
MFVPDAAFSFFFFARRARIYLFCFRASSRRVASEWSDGAPKQEEGSFAFAFANEPTAKESVSFATRRRRTPLLFFAS